MTDEHLLVPFFLMEPHCPILFDSVAGHMDQLFYGERCHNGHKTIIKKTTGWEILWYLGFSFHFWGEDAKMRNNNTNNNHNHNFTHNHEDGNEGSDDIAWARWVQSSGVEGFLQATDRFRMFVPVPCSFFFNALVDDMPSCIIKDGLRRLFPSCIEIRKEVFFDAANRSMLKDLLRLMWDGTILLDGFDDAYDQAIWKLQLKDLTSGMSAPCAMDIKLGRCCYSPYTSEAKKKRCELRCTDLMRLKGMRICGMHRYLVPRTEHAVSHSTRHSQQTKEGRSEEDDRSDDKGLLLVKEKSKKSVFYALQTEEELTYCIAHFISCTVPLESSCGSVHHSLRNVIKKEADCILHVARQGDIVKQIQELLFFMSSTKEGKYLVEKMAFVSCSLLIFFDKCASSAASPSTRVFVIDFARCGIRRLNYEEEKVGFLHGLKELIISFQNSLSWLQ